MTPAPELGRLRDIHRKPLEPSRGAYRRAGLLQLRICLLGIIVGADAERVHAGEIHRGLLPQPDLPRMRGGARFFVQVVVSHRLADKLADLARSVLVDSSDHLLEIYVVLIAARESGEERRPSSTGRVTVE